MASRKPDVPGILPQPHPRIIEDLEERLLMRLVVVDIIRDDWMACGSFFQHIGFLSISRWVDAKGFDFIPAAPHIKIISGPFR